MNNNSISRTEAIILYITFGLLFFGIVLSRLDRFWFDNIYTVEDGFIEWMTVLSLLLILLVSLKRLIKLFKQRSVPFIISIAILIVLSFFAAGEELSWGQRLFHLKSSDFFELHNSQKETNLHNLVLAGKSINLIVFSRLLIFCMALYLIGLPILYSRSEKIKILVDSLAVPVPKLYQVLSLLLIFGLIAFIPSGKRAELLEFGSCSILLLIVMTPRNASIFKL